MEQPAALVPAVLPTDVVRTPAGQPAALVVRCGRGWTVLSPEDDGAWTDVSGRVAGEGDALSLVEAMSLADLVAAEHGSSPEPGRDARRAARTGAGPADDDAAPPADPRDEEIAALRRTIGQLEHALAARVSIERALGVLAERHGTTPREAFEALRRNARSQGRPAQELATEVLDGLTSHTDGPGATAAQPGPLPTAEPRPVGVGPSARRVQRGPRRTGSSDVVPGAPR
ncbi:ANTAR domain-containing protein [Modestobacter excelsi]|uniref:ANTAR domain-containing protein n=1 Tax=Modestobacter excelsi TaxID=2213161 RepID=UPI001FECE98F|nr:ANTAR domain-containing protein [Modestobacter excelsi]